MSLVMSGRPNFAGRRKFSCQGSGTGRYSAAGKAITSMEHKDIQYSVALIGDSWRWTVHLSGTRFGSNRTLAVLAAIKAINKAAKQRRAAAVELRSRVDQHSDEQPHVYGSAKQTH